MHPQRLLAALIIQSALFAEVGAQEVPIERVKITLVTANKIHQTHGKLYKVDSKTSSRKWVADVGVDGVPSRQTRCSYVDHFEAEVMLAVAFPNDPVRVKCQKQLAFSFTRPTFAHTPTEKDGFPYVAADRIDPRGLFELSELARGAGNEPVARASADAAVRSAAIWMGDIYLDQYVKRDAERKFKLVFNEVGVAALKAKQRSVNLMPSGELDLATQRLIGERLIFKGDGKLGTAYCFVRDSTGVKCTAARPASSGFQVREIKIDYMR